MNPGFTKSQIFLSPTPPVPTYTPTLLPSLSPSQIFLSSPTPPAPTPPPPPVLPPLPCFPSISSSVLDSLCQITLSFSINRPFVSKWKYLNADAVKGIKKEQEQDDEVVELEVKGEMIQYCEEVKWRVEDGRRVKVGGGRVERWQQVKEEIQRVKEEVVKGEVKDEVKEEGLRYMKKEQEHEEELKVEDDRCFGKKKTKFMFKKR